IDLALQDPRVFQKLKNMMSSNAMGEGYPIFISSCLGENDLQDFIDKNFSNLGIKKISAEFFSSYSSENKQVPGLQFDLNDFLKDKRILLFGPNDYAPVDITGYHEYKKF